MLLFQSPALPASDESVVLGLHKPDELLKRSCGKRLSVAFLSLSREMLRAAEIVGVAGRDYNNMVAATCTSLVLMTVAGLC